MTRIHDHLRLLAGAGLVIVLGSGCPTPGDDDDALPGDADPPVFTISMGATHKVCKLTGEYDYHLDEPAPNLTWTHATVWGVDGGASFEHEGLLWYAFADTFSTPALPPDPEVYSGEGNAPGADGIAFSADEDPRDCIDLTFLVQPGSDPPTFLGNSRDMDGARAQQAGLSVGGELYVWSNYDWGPTELARARLSDPDDIHTMTFDLVYELDLDDFNHIEVVALHDVAVPNHPDAGATDWLALLGNGEWKGSEGYLALAPLERIEDPDALRFFAGLDDSGDPTWSESVGAAVPFVDSGAVIGTQSVQYVAEADVWVLLYDRGFDTIDAHTASHIWGPWSAPQVAFDPDVDGGYCGFMHAGPAKRDELGCTPEQDISDPDREDTDMGTAYSPKIVRRFTEVDGDEITLYFNISTWNPYNDVLLVTTLVRQT